jgi:hypothetical protein
MGQAQPLGLSQEETTARNHELAHQGAGQQAGDGLLVQARRQLAADVKEALKLKDLHRQPPVHPLELFMDEPVLNRGRGTGCDAAQKGQLSAAELAPLRPGAQPQHRHRASAPSDRAQKLDAQGVEHLAAVARAREQDVGFGHRARRNLAGRSVHQSPAGPHHVVPAARTDQNAATAALQLAHDDQQRGVQNLLAGQAGAQGGREVQERDQLGHPLQEGPLGPGRATEFLEGPLILEHDRCFHGAR